MNLDHWLGFGLLLLMLIGIPDGFSKFRRYRKHPARKPAAYLFLFVTLCGLFGGGVMVANVYVNLHKFVRNGKLNSFQFGTFFAVFYPSIIACIWCAFDVIENFRRLELRIHGPESKSYGPDTGDIYRNIKHSKKLYFEKFNGEDTGANDLRMKIRRRVIQAAVCALVVGIDLIALSCWTS